MIKRQFGWTGVDVPVVGQGTWMMEGRRGTEQAAVEALKAGLDLGMTHIDTAEMYGNGRVEEIVGAAIEGRRDEVFLVSKVLPSNASYEGTIEACGRSLRRLRTDRLDLYLLHWPGNHPISETMRAMEKLVDDGMTRFIGVSNFDLAQLKEAEQALSKHRLACNQVLYSLKNRGIEKHIIPYCASKGIAVVGYSPFGHLGLQSLGGKEGKVLAEIAQKHHRTPAQVVLNFLTRLSDTFAIPKARRIEHVRENSKGVDWRLDKDDINDLDRTFPLTRADEPLEMI